MEKQKKTPELRFPEFDWLWEIRLMKEVATIKTGGKDTQNKIDDGLYPFFVRSDNIERINSYSYDGEAILTSGDGVGVGKNIHYFDGKFDFHQRVYSIREFDKSVSGKFTYYVFAKNFYKRVIRLSAKNSVDSVRMEMIADMPISFPSLPEQQEIATFFTAIDQKISQLKKKHQLLEQYKKGVMQKIFSQQIRFKDDDGREFPKWEKKSLGELQTHVSDRNKNLQEGLVLSVSNTKGFITQNEQFDNHRVASTDISNYKLVRKGDFAYNPSRINVGSIARLKYHEVGVVSPMYVVFRLSQDLNAEFFENWINTHRFKHLVKISCSGSVRESLNYEDMGRFLIYLPCPKEQTKIANFLSAIDDKISHTQKQIDDAEQWKKGLMQRMFV